MLYRTLSANLNGLNLGTLANAKLAGRNIVVTSLVRHDHPQMRRDSMRASDAKLRGELSIRPSIREILPIFPSAGSPAFSPSRPYPGGLVEARPEVVVASPVPALAGASWPSMAARAAWSQPVGPARASAGRRAAMTRTEPIPAASFAAGG